MLMRSRRRINKENKGEQQTKDLWRMSNGSQRDPRGKKVVPSNRMAVDEPRLKRNTGFSLPQFTIFPLFARHPHLFVQPQKIERWPIQRSADKSVNAAV